MTEQSYLFDFHRSPYFFDSWNTDFKLNDMNASNNFRLMYFNYSPDNINDCLDGKKIKSSLLSNRVANISCSLKWDMNANTISMRNDATWNIGTGNHYPLKAVFLTTSDGVVMGYCINMNSFEVTNIVKIKADTILWSIRDE